MSLNDTNSILSSENTYLDWTCLISIPLCLCSTSLLPFALQRRSFFPTDSSHTKDSQKQTHTTTHTHTFPHF